jgi:hypothetical protein
MPANAGVQNRERGAVRWDLFWLAEFTRTSHCRIMATGVKPSSPMNKPPQLPEAFKFQNFYSTNADATCNPAIEKF